MGAFDEARINYICNIISEAYQHDEKIQPYINKTLGVIQEFLRKKKNLEKLNPDKFAQYVIHKIAECKNKEGTRVGILAAQSIGEPVTQSALSYFHKLIGNESSMNGLKDLNNIIHNNIDNSVIQLFLKPGEYSPVVKKMILNNIRYNNLKDAVLDVVYDGFNMRFYLSPHTIYRIRMHPKVVLSVIKSYLKETNDVMDQWDTEINLTKLYIEFKQPASKLLDWLDEHNYDYAIDSSVLCIFKFKENGESTMKDDNPIYIDSSSGEEEDYSLEGISPTSEEDNPEKRDSTSSEEDNFGNENSSPAKEMDEFNYFNSGNPENNGNKKFNTNNPLNDKLVDYLKSQNIRYDEQENYYLLTSKCIYISDDHINDLLENITLTGTKGVEKVFIKYYADEFYLEVHGKKLDSLFEYSFIDKTRSKYIVYSTSQKIDIESRKKALLDQLEDIMTADSDKYNNAHIELLTNFMCRTGKVIPLSRFGMKEGNFSFISRLSFVDPYSVAQDVLYGVKDDLSAISSKIITGIYNDISDTESIISKIYKNDRDKINESIVSVNDDDDANNDIEDSDSNIDIDYADSDSAIDFDD